MINEKSDLLELIVFKQDQCFDETSVIGIQPHAATAIAAPHDLHGNHAHLLGVRLAEQILTEGWALINLQFDLLTSMTTFPLRVLSVLGFVIPMAGVGFGIFLLIMRLVYGSDWAAEGIFTLFASSVRGIEKP